MNENSIDLARAYMNVAQDEMATYALLLNRAQSSLTASMQAFERANENLITSNCPTSKQTTQKVREQYTLLTNLTATIAETLSAPTFSRMIEAAPKRTPQLAILLNCLPESERNLITAAINCLLQAEGESVFLNEEQVNLAANIIYPMGR